jgi:hypothetical protein
MQKSHGPVRHAVYRDSTLQVLTGGPFEGSSREIGILLPNNQRQHRTLRI